MASNNRELRYISQMKKRLLQQQNKQTSIKGGKQKNTKTLQKIKFIPETATTNIMHQKHKSHEKHRQNNSELNSNILRVQQNESEHKETVVNETEGYDENLVRKDIINLKNDIQEIKEAL